MEKYETDTGDCFYKVPSGDQYASVTTILDKMMDTRKLEQWKQRVGYQRAEQIARQSSDRGEMMHLCVEIYMRASKEGRRMGYEEIVAEAKADDSLRHVRGPQLNEGADFFRRFYTNGLLDRIERPLFIEEALWSSRGGGFAGTVDLIAEMKDGSTLVIDFKNSKKVKKREYLKKYTLQLAAYFAALWDRHGIAADGGENWIASPDTEYVQVPAYRRSDLVRYYREFEDMARKFNDGMYR